jgi:2'-5' RNA ligase
VAAYPDRAWTARALLVPAGLDLPGHRLAPADQVHLTLHFIGPVERREVDGVRESVERSCSGLAAFDLTPLRLVGLPPGSPRLLAVETDLPPVLAELHDRLVRRLARKPSGGAYVPHVPLCRFDRQGIRRAEPIATDLPPFRVDRVQLMQSRPGPGGAEHWMLGRVALCG